MQIAELDEDNKGREVDAQCGSASAEDSRQSASSIMQLLCQIHNVDCVDARSRGVAVALLP